MGATLAQQAVDAKTYAPTAVATFLSQMVLEGRMVTMEARLTQPRVACDEHRLHHAPEMAILDPPMIESLLNKRAQL